MQTPHLPRVAMRRSSLTLLMLPALGAAILTGCIAGAASDQHSYIFQAQHYPEYLARNVEKVAIPTRLPDAGYASLRQQLLSAFPGFAVVHQEKDVTRYVQVGDSRISFRNQIIEVTRGETQALVEHLPKVFYYSDLQVASYFLGAERLTLLLAYSRQSTSMVWFGLYDAQLKPLYRTVLPRHKVWRMEPHADGVVIQGSAYAELIRRHQQQGQ